MGEIADSIIDGDFDEETGEYIGPGYGYPRSLAREKREAKVDKRKLTDYCKEYSLIAQRILSSNDYLIISIKEIDYGLQMKTVCGTVVNVYSTGKILLQGKPDEKLKQFFNI